MQRILLSSMDFVNGIYVNNDIPYSGVGFVILPTGHVDAYALEGGVVIKPYRSICIPNENSHPQVDLTPELVLEQSEYMNYFKFRNEAYTGVGYFFEGDFSNGECFVENCITDSTAFWWSNGNIQSFDAPNPNFSEMYEWYESGNLKVAKISNNNESKQEYSGSIGYTESNEISYLVANNGFIDGLTDISVKTQYFPIPAISSLESKRWANDIFLAGNDIDDELINSLSKNRSWLNVLSITLKDTESIFLDATEVPNLREIRYFRFESSPISAEIVFKIKQRHPQVAVFLNNVQM
jgi:hypothetical protein